MSNDIELTAAINFETNQASAGAAKQAVDAVANGAKNAANEVGKVKPGEGTAKEFDKVKGSAEKSFAAIDSARQVTEGGIMGLGQAVKNLASQFPALSAALGPVGLALAAFSAWKKAVDIVREAHDKLEKALSTIKLGNIEAQIRSNTAAYEAYYQSIKRAADESQRLSDVEAAKDDAKLRADVAALDLKRAQDKATISPDDEIGSRKIDLDYADKRAALEEASAQRKSDREAADLKNKELAQMNIARTAKEQQDDLEKNFIALSGERMKIEQKIQKDSAPKWWAGAGLVGALVSTATADKRADAAREKHQAEIDRVEKDKTDVLSQYRDSESVGYNANQAVVTLRGMRQVNKTDRSTLGTQSQTRQTDAYVQAMGIDRDENTQMQGMFDQIDAAASGASPAFMNWANHFLETQQRSGAVTLATLQKVLDLVEANKKATEDVNARAQRLN